MNEKLEFSAQDLGRLAYYLGDDSLSATLDWLDIRGANAEDMRRVREAAIEGWNESLKAHRP